MNKKQNIIVAAVFAAAVVIGILNSFDVINIGMFMIIDYIVIFATLWMLLTTNMLRHRINKFYAHPTPDAFRSIRSLLPKIIKSKSFFSREELADIYYTAEKQDNIPYEERHKYYEHLNTNLNISVTPPKEKIPQKRHHGKKKRKKRSR
ncbi:MAG: hypothetical protein ACOX4I_03685 [Anaerovoracaceae bacterium]